jgi:hypothetical protein
MKINIAENTHSFPLEMTKVFYLASIFSFSTTIITTVLVFTSDFLARHGLIHILLPFAGFGLTIFAIITGTTVIFKSGKEKKIIDIMLLFFSLLHVLFVGFILIILIIF